MFSTKELPSPQSLFSAYASMVGSNVVPINGQQPYPNPCLVVHGGRKLSPVQLAVHPNHQRDEWHIPKSNLGSRQDLPIYENHLQHWPPLHLKKTQHSALKRMRNLTILSTISLLWTFISQDHDKNSNPNNGPTLFPPKADHINLDTMNNFECCSGKWESVNLEHPRTFEIVAMEVDGKKAVMEDFDLVFAVYNKLDS
ncbi:unnamed protein product [Citrullus colocynthis]|uniref:Uncharacterized protein n=1 Tax=Citrullus colocynthis TaxID=252529 RepID=A0ABP0YW98_9ROSI